MFGAQAVEQEWEDISNKLCKGKQTTVYSMQNGKGRRGQENENVPNY